MLNTNTWNFSGESNNWRKDEVLETRQLHLDNKRYDLTLAEGDQGLYLRITEQTGNQRNRLLIPESGFVEFMQALDEIIRTSRELPPGTPACP